MFFILEAIRTWHPDLNWWRKVFLIAACELLMTGFLVLSWTATSDDSDKVAESCAASVSVDAGQRSSQEHPRNQQDAFYSCLNDASGFKPQFSP